MQRPLAMLLVVAAAALAGCQPDRDEQPLPTRSAPPQRAELGWVEPYPEDGPALVFKTHSLTVTEQGWEAEVEIENGTTVAWRLDGGPEVVPTSFGVMLFVTDELEEVERRGREGELPGLRAARRFDPPLPSRLASGTSWRGTISAPGSLAAGLYLRVAFGPLVAVGEPPEGLRPELAWITDHAYRLRG